MISIQFCIHFFLHLVFPLFVAWFFYREQYKKTYLVFLGTMLVDADHLLAHPIYQAGRCSVGFHPLHSHLAIAIYFFMLLAPKSRVIAIGLLMHMATDLLDCYLMNQQ
jgi:hypothetical protein